MPYRAGYIPLTALRTVAPGTQLLGATAQAWKNLVLMYKMIDGTRVAPVASIGSGYRDWNTALEFYRAGQGDRALRVKLDIDPNLKVSIAYPPGSHGGGTRIDMLFNGHSPDEDNLQFAARYGFTREFGANDTNHFQHDGVTAVHGTRSYDKWRILGRYYNGMHVGRTTLAAQSGKSDPDLVWLAQHCGHMDKSYPIACIEDGITGPHTEKSIESRWNALKAEAAHG